MKKVLDKEWRKFMEAKKEAKKKIRKERKQKTKQQFAYC